MVKAPERIFVTGASSGLGEALAIEYAGPGVVLGLLARRSELLAAVAKRAAARGARVLCYPADVTDLAQVQAAADRFLAETGGVDLVIANAGIGEPPQGYSREQLAADARMVDVNAKGVVHTVGAFLPSLLAARAGHVVAISSVAGFKGLPMGPYSATKAFVKTMMDSWRVQFGAKGIRFTTICPGFIQTPMTAKNRFWMPFLIPADRFAALARRAIARRQRTAVIPWPWRLVIPFMRIAPDFVLRMGAR